MKKNILVTISIILVLLMVVIVLLPHVQMGIWMFRNFVNPKLHEETIEKFKTKSNEYLIKQLKSKNYAIVGIAAGILYQRDEREAVPVLLELTKSKNEQIRTTAFIVLGNFNNERAIEPLMNIIDKGPNHRDYIDALRALSIMRYEPVYPLIIEILESKESDVLYEDKPYAVGMLEYYAKPESIPLLDKIIEEESKKSKGLDIHWNIQTNAEDAIKNIKNKLDKK